MSKTSRDANLFAVFLSSAALCGFDFDLSFRHSWLLWSVKSLSAWWEWKVACRRMFRQRQCRCAVGALLGSRAASCHLEDKVFFLCSFAK